MGLPVVVVASGGLAVTEYANGFPMTVATNGFGIAVTVVASGGLPVVLEGYSGGGGEGLDFSEAANSQYLVLLEDF